MLSTNKSISDAILEVKPSHFDEILVKFSDFLPKLHIFGFVWVGCYLDFLSRVDILLK